MAKKYKISDYIKFGLLSIVVGLIVAVLVGLCCGYNFILVNGWSASQTIPYQSLIITEKCNLQSLALGDFVTTKNADGSFVTHQLIGVKTEGYFEQGDFYSWTMEGKDYHAYYGYDKVFDGLVASADDDKGTPSTNYPTTCNIITMQRSQDGKSTKDYRTFSSDFVGKVVWFNYSLGKTIFILKDASLRGRLLLMGFLASIILVFVIADECKLEPEFLA